MDLSIVIPLYNEEKCTKKIVKNLIFELNQTGLNYEIVLVNNGSKDSTARIIENLSKEYLVVKPVHIKKNSGYGNGITEGLKATTGNIIGWMDGDEQVRPKDVVKAYNVMKTKGFDLIKGKRLIREDGVLRYIASIFYNACVNILFLAKIGDVNAKPKFMKRVVYENMKLISEDWFIDTELVVRAAKKGYKIGDVSVIFVRRESGVSHVKLITVSQFLNNLIHFRWLLWKKNQK